MFIETFGGIKDVRTQKILPGARSSWFGFSMLLEGELAGRRSELVAALSAAGIESRPVVAGNFARNPVMKHIEARVSGSLEVADAVHVNGLFIGNHHYPVHAEIELVADVIRESL